MKRIFKKFIVFPMFIMSISNAFLLISCNQSNKSCESSNKDSLKNASANCASLPTISEEEMKEGWKLLFDGKTTNGWRGAHSDAFPAKGWEIKDGTMTVLPSDGGEATNGGDIVTNEEYSNFELKLEVKLTEGANSGIKYFVTEAEEKHPGSALGLEFQILDDVKHPDAKNGRDGNRTIASLYDLITAKNKHPKPIGEWNEVKIVSKNRHVEHWLNGEKVVEYERGSKEFNELIKISKYKDRKDFGLADKGHLLLQDHGNHVSFRNIKIRTL